MLVALKSLFVVLVTSFSLNATPADIRPVPIHLDQKQFYCLTEAVYFEAGNQPLAGKIAVANVIKNRMKSEDFPGDSYCKVIKQRGQFTYHIRRLPNDEPTVLMVNESMKASYLVMQKAVSDNTYGATYYANVKIATDKSWLKQKEYVRTAWIGNHTFYKHIHVRT